ncbi:MAG: DUF115 domain-containing protein [Ignisphaera sp.]|nr:DUF115 domain-containing protein [Ignisphaera sp.]MDW8085835.1 DUF115 domain-containing protein [Ignisphaera sp.]
MSWLIDRGVWLSIYSSIKGELSLSFDRDQIATDTLSSVLSRMPNTVDVDRLRSALSGGCVVVLGPAPSIEHDFRRAYSLELLSRLPVVAVDGATTYLYEQGFTPSVVVTDLDGDPNHIAYVNSRGCIAVVHSHGDNIDELTTWVPRFKGPVVGSTQVEPRPHVYNFGGFTDGDRALFIAYALGVRCAVVGGMDFRGPVGRYSTVYRRKDEAVKRVKLGIAVKLIEMLLSWGMEVKALSPTGVPGVEVM